MAINNSLTSLITTVLLFLKCCVALSVMKSSLASSKNVTEPVDSKLTRFDEFDWELCKLVYNATNDNVLISPISLKLLLAILYEGAGGATAKEIESVLQVSSQEKGTLRKRFSHVLHQLHQESSDYTLHFGTSTFIDETVKPHSEFSGKLKQFYNSSIVKVPFKKPDAVVAEVNAWAKMVTQGYIEKFLSKDDISENEILMMANILFFKGLWQKPFDIRRTEPKVFHINSTSGVKIPFMNMFDDFYHLNATDIDAQILKLPYLGEQFAMYIILPNQKQGLNELMKKLHLGLLRSHFSRLTETKVSVSLPKFSFDSHTFLKPFLQQLGLKDMFSEKADLTKIAADPYHQLTVTNILQRTGMEIEETGSTAYVITEAHLANKFGDSYAEFCADRPFIFSIEHDKGKIPVFTGKLSNPVNKFSEIETLAPAPTPPPMPAESVYSAPTIAPKMNTTVAASNSNTSVNMTAMTDASHVLISAPQAAAAPEPASYKPVMGRPSISSSASTEFLKDSYFDTKLLQTIFSTKSNENILVSPASVKMTLALLLEGAGGNTASELQDIMRLPRNIALWQEQLSSFQSALKNDGKNVSVRSANCFFISQDSRISPRYEAVASKNYQSGVVLLDFKAAQQSASIVNDWVNANTRGVVDRLISPADISADLKMLLVNTVYFKGKWQLGFSPKTTSLRCFHSFDGKCTDVPTMEASAFFNYTQLSSFDTQVIELPYSDERYSMIIMLPHDANAFNKLIRDLPGQQLQSILSKMHMKRVFVSLPRFSVEHTAHLVPVLQSLGVRELFSQNADLTGIFSSGDQLTVDKIVQKSKIELDEHGTVAASATGTFVIPLSSSVATFDADKPFLFFLHDKQSGAILFEGVLSDPKNFVNDAAHPLEPQVASKIPPPNSPTPQQSQGSFHPLSSLMPSTQNAFYNLNQPDQASQSVGNQNSNKEKPVIGSKVPEILGSKNNTSNTLNHSNKKPVVQYPQSEYYQKPIPNDQDAILFSANQTNQNMNKGGHSPNQNTRSKAH